MKNSYPSLDIAFSAVLIPEGEKISVVPGGERRACGIAIVKNQKGKQCCILEVARPDKWPVSTLIIWPKQGYNTLEHIEIIMKELLEQLVKENGHWITASLMKNRTKFDYEKLKHVTNQKPHRWAERIFNKITFPTF